MCLELCYLFQRLSEGQYQALASLVEEFEAGKGQRIYNESEEALFLYILKEGKVELTMGIEDSLELPITILRERGNCFGVSALFQPYQYSLSAHSLEGSTLLKIDRKKIQEAISKDRSLGCTIMSNAASCFLEQLTITRRELKIHFKTLIKYMLV